MSDPTGSRDEPEALAEAGALLTALRELLGGGAALFATELRRAGLSLGLMLAVSIAIAVLGVSVWLLAMGALAAVAVAAGVSLAASLAVLALANAVALVASLAVLRGLSRNLGFAATRRLLSPPREDDDVHAPVPA